MTYKLKDGRRVDVLDLVDLFRSNDPNFTSYWQQAIAIYRKAFPPEEREKPSTVKNDQLISMARGEYGDNAFSYLVSVSDSRVLSMFSYVVIPADNFSFTFGGYIAVRPRERGRGIAKTLAKKCCSVSKKYSRRRKLPWKYLFLEVEQPTEKDMNIILHDSIGDSVDKNRLEEAQIRSWTRPQIHQSLFGLGALATIDSADRVCLVYYAQPALEKGEPRVELLPAVSIIEEGKFSQLGLPPTYWLEGGVFTRNGILCRDVRDHLTKIPSEGALAVVSGVLDTYEESEYSQRQIRNIRDDVERSIGQNEHTYLVPILHTIDLPFEKPERKIVLAKS